MYDEKRSRPLCLKSTYWNVGVCIEVRMSRVMGDNGEYETYVLNQEGLFDQGTSIKGRSLYAWSLRILSPAGTLLLLCSVPVIPCWLMCCG